MQKKFIKTMIIESTPSHVDILEKNGSISYNF